jgi:hypothetical protein
MPQHLIDIRGKRFGKLVIGQHSHTTRSGAGAVRSCGCMEREHRAAWPAQVAATRRAEAQSSN